MRVIRRLLGRNAMSFQGHIEKGMVVLDQPLFLPDGTQVRVEAIFDAGDDVTARQLMQIRQLRFASAGPKITTGSPLVHFLQRRMNAMASIQRSRAAILVVVLLIAAVPVAADSVRL